MPRHFVRVDLAGGAKDFERVAVQPGSPLLDSSGSNLRTFHKWLGSRIAGAKWDGDTVLFYARGRDGSIADDVAGRPATEAELRGRLQPELEALKSQLKEVQTATPNEASLHRFLTSQLEEHISKIGAYDPNPFFFQVKSPGGESSLIWCCGYARKSTPATAARVCPNGECGLLTMTEPESAGMCARCDTPLKQERRFPWLAAAVVLLILLAAGVGGGLFWMNSRSDSEVAKDDSTNKTSRKEKETRNVHSLRGQVVDAQSGRAIADVQLRVNSTEATEAAETTDDEGKFELNNLADDSVEIEFTAAGYAPQTIARQFPADGDPTEPGPVEIKLKGSVVLAGTIIDVFTEQPVAGATVSVGELPVTCTTDSDGHFQIEGLRGGVETAVTVTAAGYQAEKSQEKLADSGEVMIGIPLTGNAALKGTVMQLGSDTPVPGAKVSIVGSSLNVVADDKGEFQLSGIRGGSKAELEATAEGYALQRLKLDLPANSHLPVRIGLAGEAILTGQVVDATTDKGIGKAQLNIVGTPHKTQTKEDGSFRIEGCRSGKVKITVTAPGYPEQDVDQILATGKDTELVVKLAGEGLMVGEVVDSVTGSPVADAAISLKSRQGKTDKDGKFRFDRVPLGAVDVEIAAPGYLDQQLTRRLVAEEESSLLVRLVGDASLVGQVIEVETKKPVAGAFVTLEGSRLAVKTDEDGRFRMDGPRSGKAKLNVTAQGFDAHEADVQLASSKETKLVIELGKTTTPTVDPVPKEVPVSERPFVEFFGVRSRASSVGFVVDCSGSMSGERIRRTKAELAKSIIDLNPKQHFFISFFSDSERPMPGRSPVPASPLEKVVGYNWMKTVPAAGGTEPESALQLVAKMKPHVIFLLSDGEFSPLSDETLALFEQNKIAVNTLAFEDESGAELLKGIANTTGGTYRFVPVGKLPANFELMIDTRLAMLLADALADPSPSDPQQYRKALVEFCDQEDFGPRQNATPAEVEKAISDWKNWWVQYKLVPYDEKATESELLKEMRHPEPVRRWAALEAARIRKLDAAGDYIVALQDIDADVRAAAHRALVALAGRDYGSVAGTDKAARDKAIAGWKGWLSRQKIIAGFPKLSSPELAVRFGHADADMRKAAFAEAARRKLMNPDAYIAAFNDPDIAVRNAAHDALVKSINGQVDHGPAPDAGADQWQQAAEKWQAWRDQQIEQQAQLELRQAKALLRKKDPATMKAAERRLLDILKKYPKTKAAKEIQDVLDGN